MMAGNNYPYFIHHFNQPRQNTSTWPITLYWALRVSASVIKYLLIFPNVYQPSNNYPHFRDYSGPLLAWAFVCTELPSSVQCFTDQSPPPLPWNFGPHRELCMFQWNSSLQNPACVATSYQLWRSGLAMSRFGRRNDAWPCHTRAGTLVSCLLK